MINDLIKAKGQLRIVVTGPDGSVKDDRVEENVVVTVGKNFIASRMVDTGSPTHMTHMAVGTSATGEVVGDTTLGTELARVALTGGEGTPTANTVQYVANFSAGTGTGALVEAGIFNAAGAGVLLCRTTFSVVNKGADDTLAITWTITIG